MGNYHEWGSEFDFNSLEEASYYIQDNCRRWARMGIWVKEKYGTLCISTTCAYFHEYDFLHTLVYPGHAYIKFPKWFRTYIDWPFGKCMRHLGVIWALQKWQRFILKHFWQKAAKKWPHISEEILDEFQWEFPHFKGEGRDD